MAKSKNTRTEYRHAGNGKFISESTANRMKKENYVKETVPNPGHGIKKQRDLKEPALKIAGF